MLDIPGQPVLDKLSIVGTCLRLPLRFDANRFREELNALPSDIWGSTGGRVGVHLRAEALFLRGHAPAQGDLPVEDRPVLDALPYARSIIETLIPAPAMRCLIARLPAGAVIAPHIDRAPYFSKTLRLHFPIETHEHSHMWSQGHCFSMREGEVWALNNSAAHGVWNADPTRHRTHMICDFLPSPALLGLLAQSEREPGAVRPDVESHIRAQA